MPGTYLHEMSHLPEEHTETIEYLRSGGFSVQMREDNPFRRIPVDQTCEETVNKDTQMSGGTKGFSLRPNAVSKFYLVAKYGSTFLGNSKICCISVGPLPNTKIYSPQESQAMKPM